MTSITPREASLESTHLGFQRHTQGQYVEALQTFDAALELDDTMCLAWICKGMALLELNRLPEAQAAFERALSLDPSNSTALQGYATAQGISRDE